MEYDLTLAEQAYALAEQWNNSRGTSDPSQLSFKASDLNGFDTNQIGMFFPNSMHFCYSKLMVELQSSSWSVYSLTLLYLRCMYFTLANYTNYPPRQMQKYASAFTGWLWPILRHAQLNHLLLKLQTG
jgi:hypothetical protein